MDLHRSSPCTCTSNSPSRAQVQYITHSQTPTIQYPPLPTVRQIAIYQRSQSCVPPSTGTVLSQYHANTRRVQYSENRKTVPDVIQYSLSGDKGYIFPILTETAEHKYFLFQAPQNTILPYPSQTSPFRGSQCQLVPLTCQSTVSYGYEHSYKEERGSTCRK